MLFFHCVTSFFCANESLITKRVKINRFCFVPWISFRVVLFVSICVFVAFKADDVVGYSWSRHSDRLTKASKPIASKSLAKWPFSSGYSVTKGKKTRRSKNNNIIFNAKSVFANSIKTRRPKTIHKLSPFKWSLINGRMWFKFGHYSFTFNRNRMQFQTARMFCAQIGTVIITSFVLSIWNAQFSNRCNQLCLVPK